MKFRKKPVVIDAYQTDVEVDIPTFEGTMHASVGDWIITGVQGERYPCKPDIFEQTYDPVEGRPEGADYEVTITLASGARIVRRLDEEQLNEILRTVDSDDGTWVDFCPGVLGDDPVPECLNLGNVALIETAWRGEA